MHKVGSPTSVAGALLRIIVALAALSGAVVVTGPAHAATIKAKRVADGLAYPAGFTVAPDGKIIYGQLTTGQIRILDPATSKDSLFYTVPNIRVAGALAPLHGGDVGLRGIALHPDYPSTPYVYAFATQEFSGVHKNRIFRITNSGGTGTAARILYSQAAGVDHHGGRILFGPDGKLYAVVGEEGSPADAQDLSSNAGKMLRMTASGGVPSDNPFAGSYVFAYGIRNSFGFDFDPRTGFLWETENGPECNDELNLIRRARNYGWGPSQTCSTPPAAPANTNQDGPNPMLPKAWYTPTIAPTGAVFCVSCGLGSGAENRLFFGAWVTNQIRAVTLNRLRTGVASQAVVYTHPRKVLSLEAGPDGTLYFSDRGGIYKLALA